MSVIKDELRRLVDILPDEEVLPAIRYLQFLIANKKNTWEMFLKEPPVSEELLTDYELTEIAEAKNDVIEGRVKPWNQVKEELGL